jgi:hypothetical protein
MKVFRQQDEQVARPRALMTVRAYWCGDGRPPPDEDDKHGRDEQPARRLTGLFAVEGVIAGAMLAGGSLPGQ